MKFSNLLSDDAVTEEIGRRMTAARIERQMTQAQLAEAAGVSKRTVERLEDGGATQLANFIRCLRALDMLDGLERLLPQMPANPIELLGGRQGRRMRARPPKGGGIASPTASKAEPPAPGWVWGDKR
jgi:transcriptional regulator with XRE-family HTH domain